MCYHHDDDSCPFLQTNHFKCMIFRGGVKIPWPGYLAPPPRTPHFYVREILKNPVQFLKKSWYRLLQNMTAHFINLYFLRLGIMLRGLSGREGGGEDTLAGVSCPQPIFTFKKFEKKSSSVSEKELVAYPSSIVYGMSGNRIFWGGGVKIPWPGYLTPHPALLKRLC